MDTGHESQYLGGVKNRYLICVRNFEGCNLPHHTVNRNLVFNDNIFDPFIKVFEKNLDHPKINRVGYCKSHAIYSFEIEKCKVATEI